VLGHSIDAPQSARQSLQPLMLAYAFDSIERDGRIVFRMRGHEVDLDMTGQSFALDADRQEGAGLEFRRASGVEMPDAVRVSFLDAENDYQIAAAEAAHPTASLARVEDSRLPLALPATGAREVAERWLAETRVTRDQASFGLPLSLLCVEPGDLLRLPSGRADACYRVDQIEEHGLRVVEARRVENGIYVPLAAPSRTYNPKPAPLSPEVFAQFLDLPLLRGDEIEHAPWLAVAASPWPGTVAAYMSATQDGFTLNRLVASGSIVGTTLDPVQPSAPWLWSRGPGVHVQVTGGMLQSRSELDVLNGANIIAVRSPGASPWEIMQFRDAQLVATDTYLLSGLLRGQCGTEFLSGSAVPSGADVVAPGPGLVQIDLPPSDIGLARNFRVGLAGLPVDDPSYAQLSETFAGVGLRPYAPVQLRAIRTDAGEIAITWVRRTRANGDGWDGFDVPLNEDSERYLITLSGPSQVTRSFTASVPAAIYAVAEQLADQASVPFDIDVAQISARFGAGPSTRITFNG
jgi:Putative phage tail protein